MQTNIVKIGNSQGVRIPKALLAQTNLHGRVKLEVRNNKIVISPADDLSARELAIMSEKALSDWNSPEEDAAWAHLQ
jgi:antitoxin MazE